MKHLTDVEITMASDGEITGADAARILSHLARCEECRARQAEIEAAMKAFLSERLHISSGDGPRALLRAKMNEAELADTGWQRTAVIAAGLALLLLAVFGTGVFETPVEARSLPDPVITPGAALPLTARDVCAVHETEVNPVVPQAVAYKVFASYGIQPKARAYEMDYLISPALGGADSINNFWPQPYSTSVWNAHVKDALEDHMRKLVCSGELDLAIAQRDIARDWVAAYKKYFRSEKPLAAHVNFTKDRAWE